MFKSNNKNIFLIFASLLIVTLGILGGVVSANIPSGTPLINVTYTIINDSDSGYANSTGGPYWALDTYNTTLVVWSLSDNTYQVNVTDNGTWCTFVGAESPNVGILQLSNGCGPMVGGYDGVLTTNVIPVNTTQTTLGTGTLQFGGTEAGILKGNATDTLDTYNSWIQYFFPGTADRGTSFAFGNGGNDWGWNYTYIPNGNVWVDSGTVSQDNSGDLIVPINVTYQLNNALDSGNSYWALDNYTENLVIIPTTTPNVYQVNVTDTNGTFCTFVGALSPNAGTSELSDGCGTIIGGYDGLLTNTTPLNISATNPGIVNLNGTKTDVLKNTLGSTISVYDSWEQYFFPSTVHQTFPNWGWTYTLPNGEQWVDASTGITGDILVPTVYNLNSNDSNNISVNIIGNTTIIGNSSWDGIISEPIVISGNISILPLAAGSRLISSEFVEVGSNLSGLNLSQPVEITIPKPSGFNSVNPQDIPGVGYLSPDGTTLTGITACDPNGINESNLVSGEACYYNNDQNITIWTTHFTQFVIYSELPADYIPSSSGGSGGSSGISSVTTPVANTANATVSNNNTNNQPANTTNQTVTSKTQNPTPITGGVVGALTSPWGITGIVFAVIVIIAAVFIARRNKAKSRFAKA